MSGGRTRAAALVSPANAAGVIGTETTVFEPLATAFAEACMERFWARTARLASRSGRRG